MNSNKDLKILHETKYTIYSNGRILLKKFNRSIGTKNHDGYIMCSFNGKTQLLHRIIYEKFKGEIPYGFYIKHINNDKDDNSIENLKSESRTEIEKKFIIV